MHINHLQLKNFRNHAEKELDFVNGTNLIVGANGAGKTNILEAIHLISTTKSLKAKYDRDIIKYDQDFCTINLSEQSNDLELQIIKNENFENTSVKKAKVNKTPKALHYFTGLFTSVLFTPEDIELLTGSPASRRKYLDLVLVQTSEDYKKNLSQYGHAIRQRNKLLESLNEGGFGFGQMDYWNDQILRLGTFIQQKRQDFFEYVKENIRLHHQKLNSTNQIATRYLKNEISAERLSDHAQKEIYAKTTLVGPHRDDFEIELNDKNIAQFGSRGQQRTAILALKLSEIDFIESKKSERPVLLLDDIFSELDENHRQTVMQTIQNQQTIITATDVMKDFLGSDQCIINL